MTAPSLEPRFRGALTFEQMVASATTNVELYRSIRSRAHAPEEFVRRIAESGRQWHLLVISEDWCGDAVNIVPFIDALASASPDVAMRLIPRDENLDLMDQYLTNGRSRSIPVVLVLDDEFVERGWWGPRPRALQAWFESPEAQGLTKDDRYKELRRWYARDRGRTILEEITQLIEAAALQPA